MEPNLRRLVMPAKQEAVMSDFKEGDSVKWNWGNGTGTGEVVKRYTRKTTLTIKGSDVPRDASDDEPAFRIKQDDGNEVLKSITEIEAA
jgi:hypothetical protein